MPLVHVKTGRVEYKFEIRDKYTIIKGDSGEGKTTFYELVRDLPKQAGINLSPTTIHAVPSDIATFDMSKYSGAVFVIDEDNPIFKSKTASTFFSESDNYFVIITRRLCLDYLTVNIDSVKRMKTSGKFHTLEPFYGDNIFPHVLGKEAVIIAK